MTKIKIIPQPFTVEGPQPFRYGLMGQAFFKVVSNIGGMLIIALDR
jgi:hypothetical protein